MAKLLVIDDDRDTCEYLKEFFEHRKCIVSIATSGQEGIVLLKKERPDIVLLDVKMEGMDGLEVLKEIKAFDAGIKVLMVTVASEDDTRQTAQSLGQMILSGSRLILLIWKVP